LINREKHAPRMAHVSVQRHDGALNAGFRLSNYVSFYQYHTYS